MKNIAGTLVAAMAVLAVGCDPGMSISQTKPAYETAKGNSAAGAQIAIDVKTSRQLVGETWYVPQVRITNSHSLITVTSVDLISRGVIYSNKPIRPGFYPLVVQAGKTEDLLVWFDLNDPVYETFKEPSELQVHYRMDSKEEIVHTSVVGHR